jgi:hypothetical protein
MREKSKEIELHPDAWARFERAVDAAIKSGPKHRALKTRKVGKVKTKPAKARKQR